MPRSGWNETGQLREGKAPAELLAKGGVDLSSAGCRELLQYEPRQDFDEKTSHP